MNEFKEYLRIPDIEKSLEYTSVLELHNIPFQLDDSSTRFKVEAESTNPWESQFILKLRESDFEKAEKIFEAEVVKEVKDIMPDHYLYTFSDKDILDVIANQNEWTKVEVNLALKIANERKLDLSAKSIKSAKKISAPESTPKLKINSSIATTASWFWIIAIFSIANSELSRRNINYHLPGLAITEILENVLSKIFGDGNRIGFIACLFISCIFFLFARYGKKNKWIFLVGLIIYTLDSIFVIISPHWGNIVFIFIALWSMITGFVNSFNETDKLQTSSSTNA